MVSEAQRSRAPMQRLADKVAAYFVPAVIGTAVLAFLGWMLFGPEPRFAHALVATVSVLIIACPCALGLATPMSIMVAVGRGAHAGVLIRNAEALETLAKVDTLVVDKTGTLTEGKPRVIRIWTGRSSGLNETQLVRFAASLERASEHPLASAVVRAASERNVSLAEPQQFRSHGGLGVEGRVDGHDIAIGSHEFLQGLGVPQPSDQFDDGVFVTGATLTHVFVAVDRAVVGIIFFADTIKTNAAESVRALQTEGVRVVMLTGDRRETAIGVAQVLGISEVEAEVQPQQKAEVVKRLRNQGRIVAMAGDGINDAPALAAADVGIAMGTGTDVAIESAGIVLVKGDLRGIVRARKLSRATIKNIRQNLGFAFLYNTLGIPIAAGVLYPVFGWLLSPMLASAAMSFSSVSVIANALRLRRLQL
jgi:Cu+-exporting ATPase